MSNTAFVPRSDAPRFQSAILTNTILYAVSVNADALGESLKNLEEITIPEDRQMGCRNQLRATLATLLKSLEHPGLRHVNELAPIVLGTPEERRWEKDSSGADLRALHAPTVAAINSTMPGDIADRRDLATTKAQLREIWTHIGFWLKAADSAESAADPMTACQEAEPFLQTR